MAWKVHTQVILITHLHNTLTSTRMDEEMQKLSVRKELYAGAGAPSGSREGQEGRIPLEAESARTDSTEGAHDVSAMKVMTGRKASTNQKHSPSTSVCGLIPEERGGTSCAQRPIIQRHNCMIAGKATCRHPFVTVVLQRDKTMWKMLGFCKKENSTQHDIEEI